MRSGRGCQGSRAQSQKPAARDSLRLVFRHADQNMQFTVSDQGTLVDDRGARSAATTVSRMQPGISDGREERVLLRAGRVLSRSRVQINQPETAIGSNVGLLGKNDRSVRLHRSEERRVGKE